MTAQPSEVDEPEAEADEFDAETPEAEADRSDANAPEAERLATDLSYRDAVEELDAIINGLDSGVVDIDTLSEQFRRAIDLIEELDRRINATRQQVERLTPRLDAITGTHSGE